MVVVAVVPVTLSCLVLDGRWSVRPETVLGPQSARDDFGSCAEVRGGAFVPVGVGLVQQPRWRGASPTNLLVASDTMK